MLKIETFPLGPLATNAYLLHLPRENRGIVIDPGMQPDELMERIDGMEIDAILLTHAHFDHIGGVDRIRRLKECPVYLHKAERDWLGDPAKNGSSLWSEVTDPIRTDPPEFGLEHGEELVFLNETFKVLHTPGHSPGSCSFVHGDVLFGGDVLFRHSIGRTDLPGGSSKQLYRTIYDTVFPLGHRCKVLPGHGPATTIGEEQKNNPFL